MLRFMRICKSFSLFLVHLFSRCSFRVFSGGLLTGGSAKLNITAREGRGDEYCGMFAEAAERVRGLIEMV